MRQRGAGSVLAMELRLLRTDTLSCGATSAASRALLLSRVCRTAPGGAERRETTKRAGLPSWQAWGYGLGGGTGGALRAAPGWGGWTRITFSGDGRGCIQCFGAEVAEHCVHSTVVLEEAGADDVVVEHL